MDIRNKILDKHLLFDGAMGTYFYNKNNVAYRKCELANIYDKDLVLDIHKEYIKSGANAIKTNTFAANTRSLEVDFDLVKKIIQNGYNIALEATKEKDVEVFADIGPIPFEEVDISSEYKKIIDVFLEMGATNFLFETFVTGRYLEELARYIKSKNNDAFIIVSFAITPEGHTKRGHLGTKLFNRFAKNEDIDAVGFNCLSGPYHLLQFIKKLDIINKTVSIMPNAGYPTLLGNKTIYGDSPKYFGSLLKEMVTLGVKIIGGCCGTTPKHIEATHKEIDNIISDITTQKVQKAKEDIKEKIYENKLLDKLNRGEKVIAVELDPPINPEIDFFMESAKKLKNKKVDAITIADCPIARARVDSSLLACKLRRELGITPIPHMTCRDRNINATKALLLGLNIEDVNNVLIVTGDPIPNEERDNIKAIFSFNSAILANYIKNLNDTIFSNKFNIFGALNVNAVNFDNELKKAQKKINSGISAFLTQPILTEEALNNVKRAKKELNAKILGGIIPIVSYRNACFMNNEISGINVSDEIIKLYEGKEKDEAADLAVDISTKIAEKIKNYVDGFYLITPFKRIDIIEKIIENINKLL